MSYAIGSILLAKDYQLPTKISDKFFIVIGVSANDYYLMSMTTSQIYFDASLITHGVIQDRELKVYCFLANQVIGKNGFYFKKHTIVSQRSNIHRFSEEKIKESQMELKDILLDSELIELLYCFQKHKDTKPPHKEILDRILSEMIKQ